MSDVNTEQQSRIEEALSTSAGSIAKLQNVLSSGAGPALKPSLAAGIDIVPVSAVKVVNATFASGIVRATITWLEPYQQDIDHYNVYADGVLVAASNKSPCTIALPGNSATRIITFGVQTVLNNGYSNSSASLPTANVLLTQVTTPPIDTGNSGSPPSYVYDVIAGYVGQPDDGGLVFIMTFVRYVYFWPNFLGAQGTIITNPTANQTFTVKKNGSTIGTVLVSTLGVVTFATSGGLNQFFTPGDQMTIYAPSPQDATMASWGFTFVGARY